MYYNSITGLWIGISHKIGSNMCYWVLAVSVKNFVWTTVQHVICNDLLDPDMKRRIDNFGEELEERLDDTNFVDDFGANFYIDDVDEANEAAHGDGANTPSDEAYEDMTAENSSK